MIKNYCDLCGKETTLPSQPEFGSGRVKVKIIRSIDSTWNSGDICKHCLIKAIEQWPKDLI
jgi:hypothetical protein